MFYDHILRAHLLKNEGRVGSRSTSEIGKGIIVFISIVEKNIPLCIKMINLMGFSRVLTLLHIILWNVMIEARSMVFLDIDQFRSEIG